MAHDDIVGVRAFARLSVRERDVWSRTMSRRKRVRKARSAARRAKRFAKTNARAHAFMVDLRERARARAEINASDAPAVLKTVLGFMIDPIGAAVDIVSDELEKRSRSE